MTDKILVVDDEESLQLLLNQRFEKQIREHHWEFVYALNGKEAIQKFRENQDITIVLTDLRMPEMDGFSLLNALSEEKRIFRIIVISAFSDMSNIRFAMNKGAHDFITKPIDLFDLESTLERAIELTRKEKAEKESQSEEELANDIQEYIIPHQFQPFKDSSRCSIYGMMLPADDVGGDFYDFFPIDDQHLGIVISDIAGKSIPAALFMAMIRVLIWETALGYAAPDAVMQSVNAKLCKQDYSSMFATAFYGILNIVTGELRYCNAGHRPPYIITKEGIRQIGRKEGIVLGAIEDKTDESFYSEKKYCLEKGEIIFLYSDGVTEALNLENDLYTEARLEDFLKRNVFESPKQLIESLKAELDEFTRGKRQHDDMTFLAVQYNG